MSKAETEKAQAEYARAVMELDRMEIEKVDKITEKIANLQPVTPEEERFLANYKRDRIIRSLEQIRQELATLNIRYESQ
jgi:DNA-directed RNA polymerase subunit F